MFQNYVLEFFKELRWKSCFALEKADKLNISLSNFYTENRENCTLRLRIISIIDVSQDTR